MFGIDFWFLEVFELIKYVIFVYIRNVNIYEEGWEGMRCDWCELFCVNNICFFYGEYMG